MKKLVLGTLISLAAAFIGAFAGFLLAAVIAVLIDVNHYYQPAQAQGGWREALVGTLYSVLPVAGAVTGLAIGWVVVRRIKTPDEELRLCAACGYDLRACKSHECPECGRAIPLMQIRFLKKL